MNESEQASQLSALFDNELPAEQVDLVIRRVSREPALRNTWERYALIGACIRHESVRAVNVAARVQSALAAEAPLVASEQVSGVVGPTAARGVSWFARGAAGGAIAAGVAAVSIFIMRSYMAPADAGPQQLAAVVPTTAVVQPQVLASTAASNPATQLVRDSAPPSYTTPVDNSPSGQRGNAPLVNYVVAHSELATSAVRFSPLSTVVYGNYDLTQDAVEMTAAEIGAHQ